MGALKKISKWWYLLVAVLIIGIFSVPAITQQRSQSLLAVMKERGLTEKTSLLPQRPIPLQASMIPTSLFLRVVRADSSLSMVSHLCVS